MAVGMWQALRGGYERVRSEDGLNVFSVLLFLNVAYSAVSQSFRQGLYAVTGAPDHLAGWRFPPPFHLEFLSLDLPLSLLAGLTLVVIIAHEGVRVWAIQLFAQGETPSFRERLSTIVLLGGGIAILIYGVSDLVPVLWPPSTPMRPVTWLRSSGFLAAPLFLLFVYLRQAIALTNASLLGTLRASIGLFTTAPLRTAGLLLCLVVLGQIGFLPVILLSRTAPVQTGGPLGLGIELYRSVLFAALHTYSIAVITESYLQLRASSGQTSRA
jgi:hypothetical protein